MILGLATALAGHASADSVTDHVLIDQSTITVPAGTYLVYGAQVTVPTAQALTVTPAEIAHVDDEALQLATNEPVGFWGGTLLQGPHTVAINAQGSFVESSLIVRRTPGGPALLRNHDYRVNVPFGGLSLGTSTTLTEHDTVYATYDYRLQRIDTVSIDAAGTLHLTAGSPTVAEPLPPALPPGHIGLFNVYRPFGGAGVTADWLFPFLEPGHSAPTNTTRRGLERVVAKLRDGDEVRVVTLGDSITVGGDASQPRHAFANLFAALLAERFPRASIELVNISLGGSRSLHWLNDGFMDGIQRYPATTCTLQRVIDAEPDLITIEFTNDMTLDPAILEATYDELLERVRVDGAEVILITPSWCSLGLMQFTSYKQPDARPYTLFLRDYAERHAIALADCSARWEHLWREGLPYVTLLRNTYNHPGDRGHALYAEELIKVFDDVSNSGVQRQPVGGDDAL